MGKLEMVTDRCERPVYSRVFMDGTYSTAKRSCCSDLAHPVRGILGPRDSDLSSEILLTVRGATSFVFAGGSQRMFAMIDTVTALMAGWRGIFLARRF